MSQSQTHDVVTPVTSTNNRPSPFEYLTVAELLKAMLVWKRQVNPIYSIRYLARRAGIKTHTLLARYLAGKALPSRESMTSLCNHLELNSLETEYALNLLSQARSKSAHEKRRIATELRLIKSQSSSRTLEADELTIFERWYHIAILELVRLTEFQDDPKWISAQLGPTVSEQMVTDAISRLIRVGLLMRDPIGKLAKCESWVASPSNLTTAAMRSFQKQMLLKASTSLDTQPVNERLFMNLTLPFDSRDTQAAKDMIAEFVDRFHRRFDNPQGDCLYSLGACFFNITPPHQSNKLTKTN